MEDPALLRIRSSPKATKKNKSVFFAEHLCSIKLKLKVHIVGPDCATEHHYFRKWFTFRVFYLLYRKSTYEHVTKQLSEFLYFLDANTKAKYFQKLNKKHFVKR